MDGLINTNGGLAANGSDQTNTRKSERLEHGYIRTEVLRIIANRNEASSLSLNEILAMMSKSVDISSLHYQINRMESKGQIQTKKIGSRRMVWPSQSIESDVTIHPIKNEVVAEKPSVDLNAIPKGFQKEIVIGLNADKSPIIIDLEKLVQTRLLIQASSGGGKSYLMRRLIEQSFSSMQQIIIDPEGEFKTLAEEFPYLVCAKSGGDIDINFTNGKMLADEVMRRKISVIIDLSDFGVESRGIFVGTFINQLMRQPQELWSHVLVFIDEAQVFCPQQDTSPAKKPIIDLAARGRKRGLCPILATQRISKVNKNVAAELLNRMVGMTYLDIDIKRAAEDMGISNSQAGELLQDLTAGEFYCFGPAISRKMQKVKVGKIHTRHGALAVEIKPPTIINDEIRKDIGNAFNENLMLDNRRVALDLLAIASDKDQLGEETREEMKMWNLRDELEKEVHRAMRDGSIGYVSAKKMDEAIKIYMKAFDDERFDYDDPSMEHYRKLYIKAEKKIGNGIIGLIPNVKIKTGPKEAIEAEAELIMQELVDEHLMYDYKSVKQFNNLHIELCVRCNGEGVKTPSKSALTEYYFIQKHAAKHRASKTIVHDDIEMEA